MDKIVYPVCCGLDVHKNILVATIAKTNDLNITSYECKTFSTINSDILKLKQWLLDNNCLNLCMESTGKYWIPVFNLLEDKIKVCLTHPKYVKAIKGKKTDKKDSKWIADIFKLDMLNCSFIPPKDIRALRDLCRYRYKLICMRTSEKNRIQNSMTVSNIGLASIVTDPFGKTTTNIMKYLVKLNNEPFDKKHVTSLLNKGLKKKILNNTNVLEYLKSQGIYISNIEEQLKVKETKQETQ